MQPKSSENAKLQKLSYNVLGVILKFLEPKEIFRAGATCRQLQQAVQMDHIWRHVCLQRWPFVHHRFDEPWKQTFKRKVMCMEGMSEGKPSEYMMIPLRAHKDYISAIEANEQIVISGDASGKIIAWLEDESKYKDEDPEPFTPKEICSAGGKVREILFHDSGAFISVLTQPNIVRIFSYKSEENKIEPLRTIAGETATVSHIDKWRDCVILFPWKLDMGNICVYECATGVCMAKIPFRGRQHGMYFAPLMLGVEQVDCYHAIVGDDLIFYHEPAANGMFERYSLAKKKTTATYPDHDTFASFATNSTPGARVLFLVCAHKLVAVDADTFTIRARHEMVYAQQWVGVTHNGPIYTIHYVNKMPGVFDVVTWNYNARKATISKSDVQLKKDKGHKEPVNCVSLNETNMVTASGDMTMAVWDLATGRHLYRLLGGSKMVKSSSFLENPTASGFSLARITDSRVVGVLGNLIRVYAFDVTPNPQS